MEFLKRPNVLAIAGHDPTGGAGILADIKTIHAIGGHGLSVITALTAQNAQGTKGVFSVSEKTVINALETLYENIDIQGIKIGMLGTKNIVEAVSEWLLQTDNFVVCDPVLAATSGTKLLDTEGIKAVVDLLFPVVDLLTPNIPELEIFSNQGPIHTESDIDRAVLSLQRRGAKSVLVKGGHWEGPPIDRLYGNEKHIFSGKRILTDFSRGTGCTLSSAIATYKAKGLCLLKAIEHGKKYTEKALENSYNVGEASGPLGHFHGFFISKRIEKRIEDEKEIYQRSKIKRKISSFVPSYLHTYLIADASVCENDLCLRVEKALKFGVTMVQLRAKSLSSQAFYDLALKMKRICKDYGTPFIINDRVDIALAVDADGVHIGQNDMPVLAVRQILGFHKILGVTANKVSLVKKAKEEGADYVGTGAIFPTQTKNKAEVIGLDGLKDIVKEKQLPVVAIGGIGKENIDIVRKCAPNGVAMSRALLWEKCLDWAVQPYQNQKEKSECKLENLIIRRAKKTDAKALSSLVNIVLEVCNKKDYPEDVISFMKKYYETEAFEKAIVDRWVWVLSESGKTASALGTVSLEEGEVKGLFVHPLLQGKSWGALLLKTAEDCAKREGQKKVYLSASLTARTFYEKKAYKHICVQEDKHLGNSFLMEKEL